MSLYPPFRRCGPSSPQPADAPISPLETTADAMHAYDSSGYLLYSKEGDKIQDEWYSVRKILAGLVVLQEKSDVLSTELVTVIAADYTPLAPRWQSGFSDGDRVTWAGLLDLMLVPSKTDAAHTIERVLGDELRLKYGIGETAQRAMAFWMGFMAAKAGAANVIATTNEGLAPDDEILTSNLYTSPHQLSRAMQFALKNQTMKAILEKQSVSVPISGGGTLDWDSIDTLRRVVELGTDIATGFEFTDYVAGKTGNSTEVNQVMACAMPSGDVVYSTAWRASDGLMYQEICRVLMQAENDYPHLRGAETAGDPYHANVTLRVQGQESPFVDTGPLSLALSSTGASAVDSDYMNTKAVRFSGAGYISAGENGPDFGTGDFTIEAFIRGNGSLGGTGQRIICGYYRSANGLRGWQLSIYPTYVLFIHSLDGNTWTETTAPIDHGFLLNGNLSHICVMRAGNDLAVFVNGQRGPVTDVTGHDVFRPASGVDLLIGARETGAGGSYEQHLTADIDEVIITQGVARYQIAGFRPRYRANRWG